MMNKQKHNSMKSEVPSNPQAIQENPDREASEENKLTKEMEPAQENKKSKKAMNKTKRMIFLLLEILMVAVGAIGSFIFSAPKEEEKSEVISSYVITTESNYRVHLLPNQLFTNEWVEEGQIYSSLLTDYIEIMLKSSAVTTESLPIKGNYTVTAVLEGYQEIQEVRKIIYERRYPIGAGEFDESKAKEAIFKETVRVRPNDHKRYAENAENILGGGTSRELYILFEGKYMLGEEEKEFSHKILIPVSSENYYDVTKPEPAVDKGEITKTETVSTVPPQQKYIPFIVLAALGLLLMIYITFFVRTFEADELWAYKMKNLMKKYGSRTICVEEVPVEEGRVILRLKEMSSMIALAEELREPVLYCMDEDGLPRDGKFYILARDYMYLLQFPKPSTTLVVDEGNFGTE